METFNKTIEIVTIKAAPGMVLCDGASKTSVGGQVSFGGASDASEWKEMTDEEADALIEKNSHEDDVVSGADE